MAAPKLDRYGLHDVSCECARCLLGFRPTDANRRAARWAYEKAEEARKKREEEAAAREAKKGAPAPRSKLPLWERHAAEREETERQIEAMRAAAKTRPATAEELQALRDAEFPDLNRGRKGQRR